MRLLMRTPRAWLLLALLIPQIGCDQATKDLARRELMGEGVTSYLGGLFRLLYIENPGAFLGMGGTLGEELRFWVFTVGVSIGLTVGTLWLLSRPSLSWPMVLTGSLILAGGAGNLIDRVLQQGRVVDFMQIGIGPVRTGIFNVADVQIMAGIALSFWIMRKVRPAEPAPTASG